MSIFATMDMKWINRIDRYVVALGVISLVVAFLTHFPELISLFDRSGQNDLFPGMHWADVANEILFTFIALLLLFVLNTVLFKFGWSTGYITWWKLLLSFVLTWIASNLLGQGFVFLHHRFDIPAIDAMVHHYLHPLRDFIITCLVNQYEALKSQLNPHMLFNSLNTLRSLIRETPDKAQDYLQELSRVLRYTLQENESQCVTLGEEMEFVRAYIFLLKMRYEDNLSFDIRADAGTESSQLPPMSVQLLIENAVKHNEISNRHPLTIYIQAEGNCLTVRNSLQPKLTASTGTRIGLANLAKRYQLLFKQEIVVREENDTFIVTIPLI